MDQEFGMSRCKLCRMDKHQGPTVCSVGTYVQYPVINLMEKNMNICIELNHFTVHHILTRQCISTALQEVY